MKGYNFFDNTCKVQQELFYLEVTLGIAFFLIIQINYIIGSECFNVTFDYSAQTGPSVISSEPTDVCFCNDNNTINCSQTQLTMAAYPGEEINISVVTVGQLNGVVPGLLANKTTLVKYLTHLQLQKYARLLQ